MATDSIDPAFLGRQQEKILAELNSLRQESRQVRAGFTMVSDYMSRLNKRIDDLERRIIDMREDTMIKLEVAGALANFETRLEERADQQFDRFYHCSTHGCGPKADPSSGKIMPFRSFRAMTSSQFRLLLNY